MENNPTTFFACNKAVCFTSSKSWWSNYRVLWGHRNGKDCEGILISELDYAKFLRFCRTNPVPYDATYKMNITLIKKCTGNFFTITNFETYNGRFCPSK